RSPDACVLAETSDTVAWSFQRPAYRRRLRWKGRSGFPIRMRFEAEAFPSEGVECRAPLCAGAGPVRSGGGGRGGGGGGGSG
ncbi:unnamed protein product, partial [Gulo gulo]